MQQLFNVGFQAIFVYEGHEALKMIAHWAVVFPVIVGLPAVGGTLFLGLFVFRGEMEVTPCAGVRGMFFRGLLLESDGIEKRGVAR